MSDEKQAPVNEFAQTVNAKTGATRERDTDFKLRAGYMHMRQLDLILEDLCHRRDHLLQLPRDRFREEALGALKRHTANAVLDLFGLAHP